MSSKSNGNLQRRLARVALENTVTRANGSKGSSLWQTGSGPLGAKTCAGYSTRSGHKDCKEIIIRAGKDRCSKCYKYHVII